MNVHYFQHVPFEGLGCMAQWLTQNGHTIRQTALYRGDAVPRADQMDALIVMGGPMGANDDDRLPWMKAEKACIASAIALRKPVLGICLGAQLIAAVLGARVYANRYREIGWMPVARCPETDGPDWSACLPEHFMAFHWHGDTFDLPAGAAHLASSAACRHQAFAYGDTVLGLQFHFESTRESIEALITNCADEISAAPFIQSAGRMREGYGHIEEAQQIMFNLLAALMRQP